MKHKKFKAVFLDRDGTIIEDRGYSSLEKDIVLIDGAAHAIKKLKQAGFLIIIVTNQSGIARGYFDEETVHRLHVYLQSQLKKFDTGIDAFYYCPHYPTGPPSKYVKKCSCRKPETGLITQAANDYELDLEASYVIGDKLSDVELALRINATGILVMTGAGRQQLSSIEDEQKEKLLTANSVVEAVSYILNMQ